jgi:hypothetical protein
MKKILICAALLQAAVFACAQGTAQGSTGETAARFSCGGVGQGEQDRFKQDAASHHALVTFSTPTGAYIAGVDVKVTGRDGQVVLSGRCEGPLMLLDVPRAGSYRIDVAHAGKQQHQDVQLGGKSARLSFVFDS